MNGISPNRPTSPITPTLSYPQTPTRTPNNNQSVQAHQSHYNNILTSPFPSISINFSPNAPTPQSTSQNIQSPPPLPTPSLASPMPSNSFLYSESPSPEPHTPLNLPNPSNLRQNSLSKISASVWGDFMDFSLTRKDIETPKNKTLKHRLYESDSESDAESQTNKNQKTEHEWRSPKHLSANGINPDSFFSPVIIRYTYGTPQPLPISQDAPHSSYPEFTHFKTQEGSSIVIRLDNPLSAGAHKSVYEAYVLPQHTSVITPAVALISDRPIKHLTSHPDSFGILGNYVDSFSNQHYQIVKRGLPIDDVFNILKKDDRLTQIPIGHKLAFILSTLPSTLTNLDELALSRYPHQDIKRENLVFLPKESRTVVIDVDELEYCVFTPSMFTRATASPNRGYRPAVNEAGIYNLALMLQEFLKDEQSLPGIQSFIEQNLNANHSERQSYQAAQVTLSHCVATLQNEHPDRYDQNMVTIKDVLTETLNNRLHN